MTTSRRTLLSGFARLSGRPGAMRDRIFDEAPLMTISPAGNGQFARFDFVV